MHADPSSVGLPMMELPKDKGHAQPDLEKSAGGPNKSVVMEPIKTTPPASIGGVPPAQPKAPAAPQSSSTCYGRVFTTNWEWVPITQGTGHGCVAVGAGVAGCLTASWPYYLLAGLAAAFCIGDAANGINLWRFAPAKDEEERLQQLQQENDRLQKQVADLNINIDTLTKTVTALQTQLQTAQGQSDALQKLLTDKTAQLQTIANQLKATQESLASLQTLQDKFKGTVADMLKQITAFAAGNKDLQAKISQLSSTILKLPNMDQFSVVVNNLDQDDKQFQGDNVELQQLTAGLQQRLNDLQAYYTQLTAVWSNIGKLVANLNQDEDKLGSASKAIAEDAKQLLQLQSQYQDLFNEFKQIQGLLPLLTQILPYLKSTPPADIVKALQNAAQDKKGV